MLSVLAGIAVAFAPPSVLSRSRVQQSRVSAISCVAQTTIEIIPVTFTQLQGDDTDTKYAVQSSTSGYGSLGSAGLTVQKGTSGVLRFKIKMKGVSSDSIANDDSSFVSTLSTEHKRKYSHQKQKYGGGLNIPMLSWIGINLAGNVEKENMQDAESGNRNYANQTKAVKTMLQTHTNTEIEVSGELTASGQSFIPVTVTAFVKIAQVKMDDGSTMNVVSSDKKDAVAATGDGKTVPTDNQHISIRPMNSALMFTAQDLSMPHVD